MSHIVHVAGPTQRPEEPFVREMGDDIARIERNYEREGAGPDSRFQDQLLSDIQAAWVVKQTRRRDAATAASRFELRPTLPSVIPGVHGWTICDFGMTDALARFEATAEEANKLLALLNRGDGPATT